MPSAAIKVEWLNGWINTSSIASTGVTVTAFRRLIVSQTAILRMTDVRM